MPTKRKGSIYQVPTIGFNAQLYFGKNGRKLEMRKVETTKILLYC
jgi:hypothetical protein